jgi:peptidylprolyl isomerase
MFLSTSFIGLTVRGEKKITPLAKPPGKRLSPLVDCQAQKTQGPASAVARATVSLDRRQALQFMAFHAFVWGAGALQRTRVLAAETNGGAALPFPVQELQKGTGPAPRTGDLVGIRFRGSYNGRVFDDIMESAEPYYMRVGSGSLVKGIEEAVKRMHVGDYWRLELPPAYAFGSKGRRASPGRPAIPPNATLVYEIRLDELPGREQELLEVTGGDLRETD